MSVHRIDQGMAAAAARLLPEQVNEPLRTRYKQLRVMLHSAGLAAAYAFIVSKSGETSELAVAYQKAGEGIRERLSELGLLVGNSRQMGARDVLAELGGMSPLQYARASAEAQALAGWLSRLADAMYETAKADADEGSAVANSPPGGGPDRGAGSYPAGGTRGGPEFGR